MAEIRHLGSWCQNVKRDFLKKNKQLTYIYWQPIRSRTWAFQKTNYWIPNIIDGWDPPSWKSTWRHFFCLGWSDLDKILQTGAEWHVDCGYIFEIETIYRIPIWRTFGRTQWHVIPEPPATLQGAATWWIHCHDSRAILQGAVTWRIQCHDHATLQGVRIPSAILKIVLCRILVFFKWSLGFDERRLSYRIVSDRLVWKAVDNFLRYRIFYYCGCFFVQNPGIR